MKKLKTADKTNKIIIKPTIVFNRLLRASIHLINENLIPIFYAKLCGFVFISVVDRVY